MAVTKYDIAPTGDGTSGVDALTSMQARFLYTPDPPASDFMYMTFVTSGIGAGETIAGVRLWWHPHTYTASKGVAKTWSIQKHNAGGVQGSVANDTFTAGATFTTLSNPEYWTISVTATVNSLRVYTNQVIDKDTSMLAYATEATTAASRPYVEITTTVPGGTKTYIVMAG